MADFFAEAASHLCFFQNSVYTAPAFFIAMDCFRNLPIPPSKKADPVLTGSMYFRGKVSFAD